MENTTKNQDFSPEMQEKSFAADAMKTLVLYIMIFIALAAVTYVIIFYSEEVFSTDIGFSNSELKPIIFTEDMEGLTGGDEVKIGIKNCEFGENTISITIYGKNFSDRDWIADGETFVISSFNTLAAETRYHYYADEWSEVKIPAHGQFECEAAFTVEKAAEKAANGYMFSLAAFRDWDEPTIELLLETSEE
ncbi:MAG: hypothetical protein ACI4JF_01340 [Oscillospiraceae bacterium]